METLHVNEPTFGKGFWWRSGFSAVMSGLSIAEIVRLLIDSFWQEQEKLSPEFFHKISAVALLAPAILVFVWLALKRYLKSGKAQSLFGVRDTPHHDGDTETKTREIWIVASSYSHVKPYDGDVKERYYKPDPAQAGGRRYVKGARDLVVGVGTMRSGVSAYQRAHHLVGYSLGLDTDTALSRGAEFQGKTYICLGSPGTNDMARDIWADDGLSVEHLFHFDKAGNLARIKPKQETLTANAQEDYAVVTKISKGGAIYFSCAGIDEEGTMTAANYLLQGWQSLERKVGSKDFYLCLKVEKHRAPSLAAATPFHELYVKDAGEKYFNPFSKPAVPEAAI
jgi:hypothetical protein